jgi:hypothetical protein
VVDSPTMHNFKLQSFGDELNHSQFLILKPSLIVDLLRESSKPLDHFKWKDRISGEKPLRIRSSEYPIVVGSLLKWKEKIIRAKI